MPFATIFESQSTAAPDRNATLAAFVKTWREGEIGCDIDHAAGVDDPYCDPRFIVGETAQIGFATDGGKGARIYFRTIPYVIIVCPSCDCFLDGVKLVDDL